MKRSFLPLALAAIAIPTLAYADLPPDVAKAVAAMGHKNDAVATRKIFDPLQPKDPVAVAVGCPDAAALGLPHRVSLTPLWPWADCGAGVGVGAGAGGAGAPEEDN